MPATKRAYSDTEKQQREAKIIEAAQALLIENNYHDINMSGVAKAANLAKGTVYLYFKTKEELFLAVFEQHGQAWLEDITQQLTNLGTSPSQDEVIQVLVTSLSSRPNLIQLAALKEIILEHNIAFDRAHQHKVWMRDALSGLGQQMADALDIDPDHAIKVLRWMLIFVKGLVGLAYPSAITQEVYEADASLTPVDFESELRQFLLTILQR